MAVCPSNLTPSIFFLSPQSCAVWEDQGIDTDVDDSSFQLSRFLLLVSYLFLAKHATIVETKGLYHVNKLSS